MMQPKPKIVTPRAYTSFILALRYMFAVIANAFVYRKQHLTFTNTQDFFNTIYRTDDKTQVSDSSCFWYRQPLMQYIPRLRTIENSKQTHVLDLGCGRGSILDWLRSQGFKWSYHGLDLATEAENYIEAPKTKDPNATFLCHNVMALSKLTLPQKPHIVTASNLFCYIKKPKTLLRSIADITTEQSFLIILDLHPSCYWSRRIDFHTYRPQTWLSGLENTGWEVLECNIHSILKYKNRPILPFAQSYLCRKIVQ